MDVKLFVGAKALILYNGKALMLRESAKYADGTQIGKYDVVGGRITPGEPLEENLRREILEETGLEVTIGRVFFVNESMPVVRGEQWHIVRVFFECAAASDQVQLSEDHDDVIWIDPAEFKAYPVIENLHPMFAAYLDLLAFSHR